MFNTTSILSQVIPVYTLPPYSGVIRFNIILSTRCMSTKLRFSVTFSYHELLRAIILSHSSYQARSFHWIFLIISVEEHKT